MGYFKIIIMTNTTFKSKDYLGKFNYLSQEKNLILRALIFSNGSTRIAYNYLCPTGEPFKTMDDLVVRIHLHGIDIERLRIKRPKNRTSNVGETIRNESNVVQSRLKSLAKKNPNLKLRSITK